MKKLITRKVIIFIVSAIVFIAVISTILNFPYSRITLTEYEISGHPLYIEMDSFSSSSAIMYEDESTEIVVFTYNSNLHPPYIKMWFGYINIPNALRFGFITIEDIKESNSRYFVFIDKKIVINGVLDADEICVNIENDATGPDAYLIPEQHWCFTGDDLENIKALFTDVEFMDHGESHITGEYKYKIDTYTESELTCTFYIFQDGAIIKYIQISDENSWTDYMISDTIDFETFETLLVN